jgi:hypothetical protein
MIESCETMYIADETIEKIIKEDIPYKSGS